MLSANSPLRELLGGPLVRVPTRAKLADVALAMRRAHMSAVLVGPGDLIATKRDLTRALAAGLDPESGVLVATIAGPDPIRIPPETTVVDAVAIMLHEEVRHLVVSLPDHSEGIVSMRNLMAVLMQATDPPGWLEPLRLAINAMDSSGR